MGKGLLTCPGGHRTWWGMLGGAVQSQLDEADRTDRQLTLDEAERTDHQLTLDEGDRTDRQLTLSAWSQGCTVPFQPEMR